VSREGVEVVEGTLHEAVTALLDHLVGPEHELVTLIEGEGASAGDTRRVAAWLADEHPGVHLEVHHGGQPLYPYLISIE
jgi:dihydroxyacetone kinase-like predicted kinase